MGVCWKSSSRCERDRYNSLMNEKRREYPNVSYNFESWKKVPPALKLTQCNSLGADVNELRLLKAGKIEDAMLSDGHRVDERGKKVYTAIYNEYSKLYMRRYCDPILQTDVQNKDALDLKIRADKNQARIEKDTEKQRTIIIAVGGVVLLLGTVIILRKL
tara:strand:- start:2111 stop:2590 length:480 start_codon:yes stop_codon:yes gene_type:complete